MTAARIELPPKLVPVFSGEARYRGAYGGRGSGKTRSFAKMSAVNVYKWASEGINGQVLCGREYQNSLQDSSFMEVVGAIQSEPWLLQYFDIGQNYIRTSDKLPGQIYYTFSGLRHNLDSLKSKARILLAWIDEAENVSEMAWAKLLPTVREEGSEIWVTWNPESPDSATHMRFRHSPPEGSKIVKLNWRDNPWFPKVLDKERTEDQMKRGDTYQWIWEGGFNDNQVGAIYASYLVKAKEEQRIIPVPYKPGVPVITGWDLGKADSTSIWFGQRVGFEYRVIDFYENSGQELEHYVKHIRSKPYDVDVHYLPHDSTHERLGMKGSIKDQLSGMGLRCEALPVGSIQAGIELVRTMLKTCYIDEVRCEQGLKCLRNYKYHYNDDSKTFTKNPVHDWSSHAADAARYLAQGFEEYSPEELVPEDDYPYRNYNRGGEQGWMG